MNAVSTSFLRRLRHTLDSLGLLNGSLYLLSRLLERASAGHVRLIKYVLVAQPLGMASAMPLRSEGSTRIEPAGLDHPLVAYFPRPTHVIARRYQDGALCMVASVKNQFAGYLWWRRDHYDEDEVRCRFVLAQPAVSSWDFDVFVEPRYRLGRVMVKLWQAAERHLLAEGVHWSFSRISAFNAESLASHARLGAAGRSSAFFVVAGPVQLSMFTCRPFLHLSIGQRTRPVLRLSPPPGKTNPSFR